ncbi:hypothetical protein JM18_008748 [Phytophthora kernoviae]|uniref:NAD(+) ADP-ribosyltransferase n=1 Tax=Phytophthora kernoviae TaxID=325452 RepID=A0A921SAX1_9STRA|nr:hypothetical protein JM18_008748 [Phytophthora kernoviae]
MSTGDGNSLNPFAHTMTTKRKWLEEDWEVVMPAQSFVALLAAAADEEQDEAAIKIRGKRTKKNKKKAQKSTRHSSRGKKTTEDTQEDVEMDATQTKHEATDEFWLAQLQDDVTENMLDKEDVCVHVTWLNKLSGNQYERAYDEQVDVGSILCHVYLRELSETILELTPKSLTRVERSLARTKARLAGDAVEGAEEEEDNEPITDVRNLQLAAQTSCGFAGGDLPLAKQDELRAALEKLHDIRVLLEEKEELVKEIGTASGDLTDEGATRRALLATRHEALTEKVSERSSRYYEIMPCAEDALASSIRAFDQVSDVDVEITRLKLLIDIMETYKMLLGAKWALPTQNPLEYCYHALQVRLAPLPPADAERQLIHRYFFGGYTQAYLDTIVVDKALAVGDTHYDGVR